MPLLRVWGHDGMRGSDRIVISISSLASYRACEILTGLGAGLTGFRAVPVWAWNGLLGKKLLNLYLLARPKTTHPRYGWLWIRTTYSMLYRPRLRQAKQSDQFLLPRPRQQLVPNSLVVTKRCLTDFHRHHVSGYYH